MDSVDPISNLRAMRDSIDNIDAAIVRMLAERFPCTRVTGELKAQHGLPPRDTGREAEQVSGLRRLAAIGKLDPDSVEKFLALVIREAIPPSRIDSAGARGRRKCVTSPSVTPAIMGAYYVRDHTRTDPEYCHWVHGGKTTFCCKRDRIV